jgi:hypothetical protein
MSYWLLKIFPRFSGHQNNAPLKFSQTPWTSIFIRERKSADSR